MEGAQREYLLVIVVLLALLLLTVGVNVALLLRGHREKTDPSSGLDLLTGLGSQSQMLLFYNRHVNGQARSLYYMGVLHFDDDRVRRFWGEARSEELQKHAAQALLELFSEHDAAARVGEGWFAVVFRASPVEYAEGRCVELVDAMEKYAAGLLKKKALRFCMGVHSLKEEAQSFETALENARDACFWAEERGAALAFTTPEFLQRAALQRRLQCKLSDALDQDRFRAYTQFIYHVGYGCLVGAETLSRWNDPDEGLVLPEHFVGSTRMAGLMDTLDLLMLEKACRMLERAGRNGRGELWLSCNLARSTISADTFLQRFRYIVSRFEFHHENLVLEITEDTLVSDLSMANRNIAACKEAGFRIALDDFGAGYSAMADLCDYAVDIVKMDRQCLLKAQTEKGRALLKSMCRLAHDMGLEVICEGVETEEQKLIAIACGCDMIQGYYFSPVLPEEEAVEFFLTREQGMAR